MELLTLSPHISATAGPIDRQALLFGADPTTCVVAVEARDDFALLYRRNGTVIQAEKRPFSPWLLTTEKTALAGAHWSELSGGGRRWLATFCTLNDQENARRRLRALNAPVFGYGSPEKQYLMQSGVTLFKGMLYDDSVRLQLDLETDGLNPNPPSNRILMAALRDNRGWERAISGTEREIIEGVIEAIHDRDPDTIEGHNLFGFDLPYLDRRARRLGIPLRLGRDGSEMRFLPERNCAIGGMSRPYVPARIHGRNLLDSFFAAHRFDWARGEWESYSLKEVAKSLGVSEERRILVDRSRMVEEFQADPERVTEYALQDVRETASILAIVGATDFYLAQMVPDTYERVAVGGTGEKVESLMAREYLRQGQAIPLGHSEGGSPGGYTECRRTGVLSPVVKVDVESLYPSLMLSRKIAPKSDRLGIFLPLLEELTSRRFDAKSRLQSAPPDERDYWDGVQGSFKVLINSFYGYLCAGVFAFRDSDAAGEITRGGQAIVRHISDEIERRGGKVIEVDTDGVYFQPPPDLTGETEEREWVAGVAATLPDGIRLAYEGRYAAMLSMKTKNYALVDYDGAITYRGSALRSRSDEKFGREFMVRATERLVAGDTAGLSELYRKTLSRIMNGEMEPHQFVRRERVTGNTFGETLRDRWEVLLPGVKIGDYVRVYRRRDGKLERIENYAGDEDRATLAEKLYKFAARFKPALGDDFERIFPRPRSDKSGESVALQTGFDF